MKSSSEILNAFYTFVTTGNISITGRVYQGKAILTDQSENIEINVLFNNHRYIQNGTINLNLYVMSRADNTPNVSRMQELSAEIVSKLGDGREGNYRFQIEQESGLLKDEQSQDKMYFINYKFNYQTIN